MAIQDSRYKYFSGDFSHEGTILGGSATTSNYIPNSGFHLSAISLRGGETNEWQIPQVHFKLNFLQKV